MKYITHVVASVACATFGGLAYGQCEPQQAQKLVASDGAVDDRFGISVSISGDTALIGAFRDDDNGTDSGSAYVFNTVAGSWIETAKLIADDGTNGDWFGQSVSLSADTAVVGAQFDIGNGSHSGSAYVFEKMGLAWVQTGKVFADDGASADKFGFSVSISGATMVIGVPDDDDNGAGSGSAYVFEKVDTSGDRRRNCLLKMERLMTGSAGPPVFSVRLRLLGRVGTTTGRVAAPARPTSSKRSVGCGHRLRRCALPTGHPAIGSGTRNHFPAIRQLSGQLRTTTTDGTPEPRTCLRGQMACGHKQPSSSRLTPPRVIGSAFQ